ncbi:hypothetical protein [Nonomuraea sp. NPDC049129]|uniref:hypothetical protein n=1 Tax=Nonomuraea sp. NPDC049129 TaxID=3155272 RepID=UPI0033CA0798
MEVRAPHRSQQGAYLHNGFAVHLDDTLADRLEALAGAESGTMLQIRSVGGAINDVDAEDCCGENAVSKLRYRPSSEGRTVSHAASNDLHTNPA